MRLVKILLSLAVLMTVAVGCGGSSPEEALVEEVIERSGNGVNDIDISNDGDDFNMTIEGEDGETINVSGSGDDEDFTMVIEGEDGEVMSFGTGEIPEGMTTPVPDGGEVTSTFNTEGQVSVNLEYPQSRFDELVATYDDYLTGDEVQRYESSSSNSDGTIRLVTWVGEDPEVSITVSDCYSTATGDLDAACLSIFEATE